MKVKGFLVIILWLVASCSGLNMGYQRKHHVDYQKKLVPDPWSDLDAEKVIRSNFPPEKLELPTNNRLQLRRSYEECLTHDCVLASADLIDSMDAKVDPCEDFYTYACGGFIDKTEIRRGQLKNSVLKGIQQKSNFQLKTYLKLLKPKNVTDQMVKDFYHSCIDTHTKQLVSYEPLITIFKEIEMPFATFLEYENSPGLVSYDPSHLLKVLTKTSGEHGFFVLNIKADPNNATSNSYLELRAPSLAFEFWGKASEGRLLEKYSKTILEVAKDMNNFLASKGHKVNDQQTLEKNVRSFLQVEKELSKGLKGETTQKNVSELSQWIHDTNDVHVRSLPSRQPINLTVIIGEALDELVGYKFEEKEPVYLTPSEYFDNLLKLLKDLSNFEIINYLSFREFIFLSKQTSARARKLWEDWEKEISVTDDLPNIEDECLETTTIFFGAKISQFFKDLNDGNKTKRETGKLIENLRKALYGMLNEAEWMNSVNKLSAKEKLAAIKPLDGFKAGFDNFSLVDVYNGIQEIKPDQYLINILKVNIFWTKKYMSNLGKGALDNNDPNSISFNTAKANAFYNLISNAIFIPLGVQKPPAFRQHQHPALTYGRLGYILGHELTHGFDEQGSHYDKDGNSRLWWTNETFAKYQSKNKCFVDQYSNYSFPIFSKIRGYHGPASVNGNQTLNENIADNGGLAAAFRAYKIFRKKNLGKSLQKLPGLEKFTDKQLFFLGFGTLWCETSTIESLAYRLKYDVHSPSAVRVRATLSNNLDFRIAFNCKKGQKMVKDKPCKVW